MKIPARGYIASGEFNGNRVPQHLQNQIVRSYCEEKGLQFILSRAEYWINGSTQCQLWATLKEGLNHIVFFSLWQLPNEQTERHKIYRYCLKNAITLHFATEKMKSEPNETYFNDLEILIKSNLLISKKNNYNNYLIQLKKFLETH